MGNFAADYTDIDYSSVSPAELGKLSSELDPADSGDREVLKRIFLDTADGRGAALLGKNSVEHLRTHFNKYGMSETQAAKAKKHLLKKLSKLNLEAE